MANIFEKIIDQLNKPLPGMPAPKSKPAAPAPVPAPKIGTAPVKPPVATTTQQKAPDIQAQLRKRELDIRQARAQADAAQRAQLEQQRKEIEDLRRKYETEMVTQAQVHTAKPDWTHTVVPGDTLSGIARKYYGKAARWPEIYDANKDKIKNPNMIYPGQVFVIPDKE
jgi:nucleoid-associated protein YgaU